MRVVIRINKSGFFVTDGSGRNMGVKRQVRVVYQWLRHLGFLDSIGRHNWSIAFREAEIRVRRLGITVDQ